MGLVVTDYGIKEALAQLGVKEINDGSSTGSNFFSNGELLSSFSPVDGKLIAKVKTTSAEDYENVMSAASSAFLEWRKVPARRTPDAREDAGADPHDPARFGGRGLS